jgi:hypothetical protein
MKSTLRMNGSVRFTRDEAAALVSAAAIALQHDEPPEEVRQPLADALAKLDNLFKFGIRESLEDLNA